jgi:hypothetical protein
MEQENKPFHHYNAKAIIGALEIIFKNNLFKFGDTPWRQTLGTGMGILPIPPWATILLPYMKQSLCGIGLSIFISICNSLMMSLGPC